MLHPLQIDEAAGVILRCECLYIEIFVSHVVAISAKAVTSRAQGFGLNGRMIVDRAARSEERSDAVGQPESGEDVRHLLSVAVRDIALRVHHGDIGGKTVLTPDVEDVADELRLAKEVGPDDFTGRVWIMLEAHEGEIGEAIVLLQIIEETSEP